MKKPKLNVNQKINIRSQWRGCRVDSMKEFTLMTAYTVSPEMLNYKSKPFFKS